MSEVKNCKLDLTKHAWYSPTQESVLKRSQESLKHPKGIKRKSVNGIPIYRDILGKSVRVTMVGDTTEHNTGFKDMEYLGVVTQFIGLGEFREDI